MPEPETVWAVELATETALDEEKGTLVLGTDGLVFTPAREGLAPTRIELGRISRVRRLRGSPVLMVMHAGDTGPRRTAFYFTQPPPLGVMLGQAVERPSGMSALRNPKRKARRDNVGYLGLVNREKKKLLSEWARAVRQATGRS